VEASALGSLTPLRAVTRRGFGQLSEERRTRPPRRRDGLASLHRHAHAVVVAVGAGSTRAVASDHGAGQPWQPLTTLPPQSQVVSSQTLRSTQAPSMSVIRPFRAMTAMGTEDMVSQ